VLVSSGFKVDESLVEIMNPRDEGLYAWFTVNFLLDNFSQNLFDSYVSLDLGGGSTQITFAPDGQRIGGLEGRKHFLHNVTLLGGRREIYSHSYLGLGLMAARREIFTSGRRPLAV
jgi:Golgi nucleoside diphosphatase